MLALFTLAAAVAMAAGSAGRAFPLESENYAIDLFQKINPRIEWDDTNYLIDLAGQFTRCRYVNTPTGQISVENEKSRQAILTPEGDSIVAIRDIYDGGASDVVAVNGYITNLLDRWVDRQAFSNYRREIEGATKFGCSVRPTCRDTRPNRDPRDPRDRRYVAVVTCLFSPKPLGDQGPIPDNPEPSTTTERTTTTTDKVRPPRALAFTKQQYGILDRFGKVWDQSHFLENLSGTETSCNMMFHKHWKYSYAKSKGKQYGVHIQQGLHGKYPNRGNVPSAIKHIVASFKLKGLWRMDVNHAGCSLIPDCYLDGEETVVVSCLFSDKAPF